MTAMRLRAVVAVLAALLLAPAAFAQTTADPPTNISYNFRTGVVTFTSGSCFDSNEVHYRHATTGNFARALRPGSSTNRGIRTGDALSVLADRSYVEVKMLATGDTGCTTSSAFTPTVTYTAVTVEASPSSLDESNLNGAELRVTLGTDHAFGSSVGTTSFELVSTPSVSGLSISSVSGSANRVRTLTLGFSGNIASSFDLKVRVLAAAHNGAANLTSFTGMSVAPDTDYDTDDDGLIEISTLQQLDAVRVDLDGDGAPNPGNQSTYRRAFPGSSAGMGCPVTAIDSDDDDCTGYELTRHLDFDTDDDGDVDSNDPNSYASWMRIAGTYSATFDGNGFNIANLTASGSADASLFENVSGTIRWLGLPNVNISSGGQYVAALAARVESAGTVIGCWSTGSLTATRTSGSAYAAGLVHHVSGRVAASFSTADVRARTYAGGLVEELNSTGTVVASYATGSVRSQSVGSLVRLSRGTIRASYATGVPTDTSSSQGDRNPSCFLHDASGATNMDNYCDTDLAGITTATGATGRTTSEMQTPTSATGIYANWHDLDVDGDGTAGEDPWHFGTSSQHPVLKYGTQDPGLQRGGDYDNDDDGLIEIHSLRQLNAMRWDLDGNGAPAAGNADDYASAFYDHPEDMGCPTTAIDADDNDCTGYELDADLDFDTDGDGSTWALSSGTPTSDGNDDYHNGGAGWTPIGSRSARFNTTFNGNGHVIKNLFVNRNANDTGFFSATGTAARITSLGLEAVRLRGGANSDNWGSLVGYFQGRIAACWATGHVRANSTVGGLVGRAETASVIVASYSTTSVEITRATGRGAGLVSWVSGGSVRTSYSTGAVTGGQARAGFSDGFATIVASYWDTDISNIGDDGNADPPEGRSTADLQGETTYAGTGIYGAWDDQDVDGDGTPGEATDDDAWDFGANWQHPALKFGGFDTALQFSLQPNLVPSFGTSVTAQTVQGGRAMQPLRIPAASGGNGPITYSASGLPAGLSFDADGLGDCSTARTICGTPSTDVVTTVTITASDSDDNTQSSDQATLTFTMTVVTPSAAISATNPAALTETNLDNATVTVALTNTAFGSGVTAASFTLNTNVPGLSVGSVATVADGDTSATLTLNKDSADFAALSSLSVTVAAAAHDLAGSLTTATVTVTPTVGIVLSRMSLMLEEDPTAGGATNANVGTYTIALAANPRTAGGGGCAVSITASSGNADVAVDNDGSPQGRVLQFDQTNWNVPQTVTVTASDDGDGSDDMATIGHIRSGSGCTGGFFGFPTNLPSLSVTVNDNDTAGVLIDTVPSTPNVADPGPLALRELAIATDHSASYAVKLAVLPTTAVTVTVTSGDTDAVTVDDTQPGAGAQNWLAFTTTSWNTAQMVTVRAVQDGDLDNETVTLTHAASTAAMSEYTGLSATLQATVEDDDAPGFVFDADPSTPAVADAGPLTLQELLGSNTGTYTVRLSSQPTQDVTATITSADPGAIAVNDTDGNSANGVQNTLTFTTMTWDTPQTVTLAAQQDDDGADESVTIGHATSTASNSEYSGVSHDITVTVDDDETPGITLSGSTLTVPERDSRTYTVVLDTAPSGGSAAVVVTGARDGVTASPASLSFSASNWATARTVTVSAADDQNSANEMVTLTHRASGGEYDGLTADIDVTATDDDTPSLRVSPTMLTVHENGSAGYAIRLNTEPSAWVTVTVGGMTAEVTADTDPDTTGDQTMLLFDATNWSAARTVTVSAADDDDATDESVALTHATAGGDYTGLLLTARPGVSVTVDDDDEPALLLDADPSTPGVVNGGPLSLNELSGHADNEKGYTVRLATEPTGAVTVEVSSGDQAVHVDAAPTPRMRTLTFTTTNWSMPQTVTATAAEDDDAADDRVVISHSASGSDYTGVSADLRAETTDDDTPALVVDASSLTGSGLAEGASATYTVRLDAEPTGGRVLVSVSAQGGVSVDADGEQAGLQSSLSFDAADWNVPKAVSVRALPDADGAAETATLRHSASGADYGGVTASPVSFMVTDPDTPAVLVSATSLAVNEGSSALYEVSLATRPSGGAVTVAPSSSAPSLATVSPAMLIFTASDWSAPRQVSVQGVADGSPTLSHTVSGADYGSVSPPTVSVTVRDTAAAGVRVEPPQLLLGEGDSGSYGVRLNTAPSGTVTVMATSGSTELSLSGGGMLLFSASNWNTEQRVSVTVGDDDGADDETLMVTHAVSGYSGVSSAPSLSVLVSDDDVPGFVFAPGGLSLAEGGGVTSSATYQVRLATPPTGQVAVTASSDDAGVELDTDGTPRTLSLTFTTTNWSSGQAVTVRAVADGDRVSETAVLLHEGSGGGYDGASGLLRVRVKDAEAPPPRPDPPSSVFPPEVAGLFEDLELEPGGSVLLDLSGKFRDDGPLRHAAQSSDPSVATAVASESGLRVAGLSPGVATVTVTATDLDGLSVSQSFVVSVGRLVSFASAWASAREGGTARLGLTLSRPAPSSGLRVSWSGGPDGDPSTADADAADLEASTVTDADAGDLGALSGTAEFAPGGTEAFIEISVLDDDDVEPARERLLVSLAPPPDGAGWALGLSEAILEIQEGVCDRTPAVRDALRGTRECWAPTSSDLSRRGYLGLHRLGLAELRAGDLQDLSGLRTLHLHGNRLQSLPAGLFEGLASLERLRLDGNRLSVLPPNLLSGTPGLKRLNLGGNRLEFLPSGLFAGVANLSELNLEGNPGAPFALIMRLARTDAEPWAPGPASVQAQVAEGAPFTLSAKVLADGAELSASSTSVPAGALAGPPLQAEQTGPGMARLSLSEMSPVPQGQCGDVQDGTHPCFRGLVVEAGPPLVLFKPPPGTTDEPPMPTLSANGERASIPLDRLFSPSEEGDRLSHQADSDRPDLIAVRIVGGSLVLEANEDDAEGIAIVTVTATDPDDGQPASLSFSVTVEFAPQRLLRSWRLEWLHGLQEAAQ